MTSLSDIVDHIRGRGCERLVKYAGNEIEISGLSLGIGSLKVDVGALKNKIVQLERASELGKAVDDCQYLLCTTLARTKMSDSLQDQVNRFRIMTIMAITQLRTLLAALGQEDEANLDRELRSWIRHTNALYRQATTQVLGGKKTVKKRKIAVKKFKRAKKRAKAKARPAIVRAPIDIHEVLTYQGINNKDFATAIKSARV